MVSGRTYEIEEPPVKAVSWNDYESGVRSLWHDILNRRASPTEAEVQMFLAQHPSLVPGAFGLFGESGHFPLWCGLIAQPLLPSYNTRTPRFHVVVTEQRHS
jgi:hypothetical protein